MNVERTLRDENGVIFSKITPSDEGPFKRIYHMTFNRIKNQYKTFGSDFVKAQISGDEYYNRYRTDPFYSKVKQSTSNEIAIMAIYYAINDAIQQIFGEHREPEQFQYNDIQFID